MDTKYLPRSVPFLVASRCKIVRFVIVKFRIEQRKLSNGRLTIGSSQLSVATI